MTNQIYDKYNTKVIIEPSHYPDGFHPDVIPAQWALWKALHQYHPAFRLEQMNYIQTTGVINHDYKPVSMSPVVLPYIPPNTQSNYNYRHDRVIYVHTEAFSNYLLELNGGKMHGQNDNGKFPVEHLDNWLPCEVQFIYKEQPSAVLTKYGDSIGAFTCGLSAE